jgi:hypothetical protein
MKLTSQNPEIRLTSISTHTTTVGNFSLKLFPMLKLIISEREAHGAAPCTNHTEDGGHDASEHRGEPSVVPTGTTQKES